MKRALIFLAGISSLATASTDYTADSRKLSAAALCGATNTTCQQAYISGAKDGTAAFKRVKTTYVAIRAAEVPPVPVPPPAPPPSPPPTPPPPPPEVIPTPGLASIPSNFAIKTELKPSWGTGAIPASAKPDVVGAFRLICAAAHLGYDDPIVYPGQPGKSHLHQFFGNDGVNAASDYTSLRTTGNSTCQSKLNRSGYWIPAMLNDKGQVIRPDYVSIYYKRKPKTDPSCNANGQKGCVDLPRGLRFVFGFNMLNMAQAPTGSAYFNCQGPGITQGHYANLALAQAKCPVGGQIGAIISAPSCWDGKNLDSADHRSHVAYPPYPADVNSPCPATHPYVIPTFTLGAWYSQGPVLEPWHLSSDEMQGMTTTPGSTFHADWFGAWDDLVLAMWHVNCVDKLLNCSGGDLGNGLQLKGDPVFVASPRVVPIPARP